ARGPEFGWLLVDELRGRTDEKGDYVHLSDGGHFENLGVYELIRRRCRTIVVTDAGEDRHAASDNLANLIRLVRTDFGIRIQIDTAPLQEGPDGLTRWHCVTGCIHYRDVEPTNGEGQEAADGVLIYLRASLTGDEPADIRQYADRYPAFPHQSTVD